MFENNNVLVVQKTVDIFLALNPKSIKSKLIILKYKSMSNQTSRWDVKYEKKKQQILIIFHPLETNNILHFV